MVIIQDQSKSENLLTRYLTLYIREIVKEEVVNAVKEYEEKEKNKKNDPPIINIRGIKGLAEYLKCCLATAQKYKNMKGFPYRQVGRLIIYRSDLVDEWFEKNMIPRKKR